MENRQMFEATASGINVDFRKDRHHSTAMRWIVIVCIAAFFMTWELQALAQWLHVDWMQKVADAIWNTGILNNKVYDGEVWRLVTHMFLHGGWFHIIGNLLGLSMLAAFARNCFSGRGWLLIYFGGGICAAFGQMWVHGASEGMVGASGGIMALWGATIAASLRFRRAPESERPWDQTIPLGQSLRMLAFQFIFEQFIANVGHWAHVGGLVGGFAIGWFLTLRAAPALLASREGLLTLKKVETGKPKKGEKTISPECIRTLELEFTPDFDPRSDYVVAEWETIDMRGNRQVEFEVVAGKAPASGITTRNGLVEIATPYSSVLVNQARLIAATVVQMTHRKPLISFSIPLGRSKR